MAEPRPRKADIILLVLGADNGRPVDGMTRLQKLVFLVQMESMSAGPGMGVKFEFYPDRFGPFAAEMYDEVVFLVSVGMAARNGRTVSITEKGSRFLKERSRGRIPGGVWESAARIKESHGRGSLQSLLAYVYQEYPPFTTKSEILDRVPG